MTAITDIVTVNVNVADTALTRAGFGTLLILADVESAVFSARTKIYNSITEIAADFATSLDVYKAASSFFAQSPRPPFLKVGRQEVADGDAATALAAIDLEDQDWYALALTNHLAVDMIEAKDFIKARKKIFIGDSADSTIKTPGAELSLTGITRVGQIATAVAAAPHSLANGDIVVISGAAEPEYNGTFVIENITANDFDYTVTGTPDTPATGTLLFAPGNVASLFNTSQENRAAILFHTNADTEFPACAWFGNRLPSDPGSSTWNFKRLASITGETLTTLSASDESFVLASKANVYSFIGNTGVAATREGTMGSGRFFDVQRSQDWIEARISEAILTRLLNEEKVPYTDAGVATLVADAITVISQAIGFGMLGPLLDSDSGEFYRIATPKVASQLAVDRANRDFPGIVITTQLAGAIHSTTFIVNVSV